MKKSLIIGAAIVIVVGAVAYLALSQNTNKSSTTSTTSSSSSTSQPVATITYSDTGFSPSTTTVKAGDTVAIRNTSTSDMQFDSDPHPVHTDDTDLNVGQVAVGETKTFTVTNKGTFGIHNHLNPSDKASITIQ